MRSLEALPRFGPLGFFTRELGLTKTVFNGFQRDLHLVPNAETALTVGIGKLIQGNNPF